MSTSSNAKSGQPVRVAKSHQGLLSNRPVQGFPGHLIGHYIWDKELSDRFLVFRKRFECDKAPERALLHIVAAHKYQLFVNGEYIGRGPCRNVHPGWTRYDTHDIAARLHPGANSIVVLAFVSVKGVGALPSFFSSQRVGGLFVQAELFDGDLCTVVATDDTWRVKRPERYRRDTLAANAYQDIPFEYVEADKDKDQDGWMRTDFDDSEWQRTFIRPAKASKFDGAKDFIQCLEPRPTPLLRERLLLPMAIVQTGEIDAAAVAQFNDIAPFGELDVAKRLWYSPLHPLERASITDPDNLLREPGIGIVMRSHVTEGGATRDPVVILDFGRLVMGMPELIFETEPGAVVEIAYAESMRDGKVQFYHDKTRCLADRYVAGTGRQTWRIFEPRMAIRYLQVVFRTGGHPARLLSARLVAQEYPVEERGRFECSDETLTRVWRASVDTVFLALEDVLTCDSIRERAYYFVVGELEQHHLTMYAAYGDLAITDTHFIDTARHQDADGNWPGLVMIANLTGIKYYASYYPSAVLRRHRYFGKKGFLEAQYPVISRLMGWFERRSDADGLLCIYSAAWHDWADTEMDGVNLEVNATYIQALTAAAAIADELGKTREAGEWRQQAERIRVAIRRQHWDEANGCFRDSVVDGRQARQITELSNALALLSGIASESQAARVAENLVAWSKLPAMHDANGNHGVRCSATVLENGLKISRVTPLYVWHVIDALVQAGRAAEAWAYLSASYGSVFEGADARFLPESWINMRQIKSLNSSSAIHGGGAGVAFLLSCQALGVQPLEPGFKRARIEPQIGNLTWAKGVFPSARGDIAVDWKRKGKKFELEVALPDGLDCKLVVPVLDGSKTVTHNGASCAVTGDGRAVITVNGGKHTVISGR